MKKLSFYILSFTWGIILTAIGFLVALILLCAGKKPKKWGSCIYFEIGKKNWGGMELGIVFLTNKNPSNHIRNHEYGHAIQNCYFGPFMLLISFASFVRYWYRRCRTFMGLHNKTAYDDIWFERQATDWGNRYMEV